ncbi:hypothetical protein C1645_827364 [Glomus cerebriforme]|uniref:Uncharacterized protein n=1 Tax=Glomus cerebriforme TaxID=658196 RepID=A0A397SNZ3_9GLOM|nr:hypothetical protein C1645_827364 [Glomus cerebriforme]
MFHIRYYELEVRAIRLQDLVYKRSQAGLIIITFNNEDKKLLHLDWKHLALGIWNQKKTFAPGFGKLKYLALETNVLTECFFSFVDSALKTETETFSSENVNGNIRFRIEKETFASGFRKLKHSVCSLKFGFLGVRNVSFAT